MGQDKITALVLAFFAGIIASTIVVNAGPSIFFGLTAIILAMPDTKEQGPDVTKKF